MTYSRFEDLPVWNAAIDLAVRVYALTENPAFEGLEGKRGGDLSDQLRRASLSIPLNIAEAAGRTSIADGQRHLAIARGSAMECAAILDAGRTLGVVEADRYSQGIALLERIVKMLSNMCR